MFVMNQISKWQFCLLQNLLKPLKNLIFGRHPRKISICFGNWPIVNFFHDQTMFIKDCELNTIGHSLPNLHKYSMRFSIIFWTQSKCICLCALCCAFLWRRWRRRVAYAAAAALENCEMSFATRFRLMLQSHICAYIWIEPDMEWGGALLGYAAMPRRLVISMHFYKEAAYSISYPIIQIILDERIRMN